MILDPKKLLVRYNGIGKPLTSDEREILLFALYNESEARGGVAAEAKRECDQIWRKQQIVTGALTPEAAAPKEPSPYDQLWEATACVSAEVQGSFSMEASDLRRIAALRDRFPPSYIGWLPEVPR